MVADQIGLPTWTRRLARILVSLEARGAKGMFHATGGGQPVSWHGFARAICDHVEVGEEVVPVSSAAIGRAARRPAYSVLVYSETEDRLGTLADWRADLAAFFASAAAASTTESIRTRLSDVTDISAPRSLLPRS